MWVQVHLRLVVAAVLVQRGGVARAPAAVPPLQLTPLTPPAPPLPPPHTQTPPHPQVHEEVLRLLLALLSYSYLPTQPTDSCTHPSLQPQVHEEVLRLLLAAAPRTPTISLANYLTTTLTNSRWVFLGLGFRVGWGGVGGCASRSASWQPPPHHHTHTPNTHTLAPSLTQTLAQAVQEAQAGSRGRGRGGGVCICWRLCLRRRGTGSGVASGGRGVLGWGVGRGWWGGATSAHASAPPTPTRTRTARAPARRRPHSHCAPSLRAAPSLPAPTHYCAHALRPSLHAAHPLRRLWQQLPVSSRRWLPQRRLQLGGWVVWCGCVVWWVGVQPGWVPPPLPRTDRCAHARAPPPPSTHTHTHPPARRLPIRARRRRRRGGGQGRRRRASHLCALCFKGSGTQPSHRPQALRVPGCHRVMMVLACPPPHPSIPRAPPAPKASPAVRAPPARAGGAESRRPLHRPSSAALLRAHPPALPAPANAHK